MSEREIVKNMIDRLPDDKMVFIMNILENIGELTGVDIYPEYELNDDTLTAFAEGEGMLEHGTGQKFSSTQELFTALEE